MTASCPRVLVVDDDEGDVAPGQRGTSSSMALEVYTAMDGIDCPEKVPEVQPAVVTPDIVMPGPDSWAAARRLFADPATAGYATEA